MKRIILFSLCIPVFISISSIANAATAIFAGGCFWCMQQAFDEVPGVTKTLVGYTGGKTANPTYKQVSSGRTKYYEAIKVTFNPNKVSYKKLLNAFWHNVDPTNGKGQFCDYGPQYRAAIFYLNSNQQQLAKQSKQALLNSKRFKRIATQILPASKFYPAEKYHQDYYKKNPIRYKFYKFNCGRAQRLKQIWGKK